MHLGFIMDGNRRWAKRHAFATLLGHTKGADVMEEVIDYCLEDGIEVVSFWALAKKNVEERSEEELAYLFKLLLERVEKLRARLMKENAKFRWIGNRSILPQDVVETLDAVEEETASHQKLTLVLAVGYGGQDEIVRAAKRAIAEGVDPETLDEKGFLSYCDGGDIPAPDLIVRTGGDIRHSGFYLFQSEYSEYFYSGLLWPDFNRDEFDRAVSSLKSAKRNFGK